jgi:hypothetical protein
MLPLRLLLLFIICYIVFLAVKSLRAAARRKVDDKANIGEPMVLDPQCQTYLPKADALERQGNFFCSEECARRYLTR